MKLLRKEAMRNFMPQSQSDVVGVLAIVGAYTVLRMGLSAAVTIKRRIKK